MTGIKWDSISPTDIPADLVLKHPLVEELTDSLELKVDGKVPIPYVLPHRKLMSPGRWNGIYYSKEAIERAYKNTNWNDKQVIALYTNHEDNDTQAWIGEVRNVKVENGELYGDLVIYDLPMALKLAYGKPRFGISPKVRGETDENRNMVDFVFENFSLVINPACKTTYLNSERKLFTGIYINQEEVDSMAEEEVKEVTEEKPKEQQEQPQEVQEAKEVQEEPAEETEEGVEVSESSEEVQTEEVTEEMAKKKKKKAKKKREYPYPEMQDIKAKLSEYTDFIKKYLKEHPDADLAEAAAAWKRQKEMAEMDEDTLIAKLSELIELLKKKKLGAEGNLSQTIQKMSERLEKLEKKLNEPERLSVKAELSAKSAAYKNPDVAMLEYLKGVIK